MTAVDMIPALAILAVFTRELLWLAALGILVSGIDDLAVDLIWIFGVAARPALSLPPLPARPGRFAILIPAWDESAVIGAMLQRLLVTQRHRGFHVFVGVYPNDSATQAAVRAIADPRLHMVVTPRPGPTTKADCLNAVWRAVLAFEAQDSEGGSEGRFKAVVLHDAEDVLHPASLEIYDRWIPELAMVQLPVIPFIDRDSHWISGHYLDEFAENHSKDMEVRALLGAPVPSAGVGTAIDRAVLESLAGDGLPFDETSLTEDYELGHKIHARGLRARLVNHRENGERIATREFFPATLEGAVQQKSRWLTGIALSGWDRLGWDGSMARRWMLLRDRKGPLAAVLAMLGYGAFALVLAQMVLRHSIELPDGAALPPFLGPSTPVMQMLLLANAILLAWRLAMRALFTGRVHGWREGVRAIPRAVVANIINFLATMRAVRRYQGQLTGGVQQWGKTAHRFPTGDMDGIASHG